MDKFSAHLDFKIVEFLRASFLFSRHLPFFFCPQDFPRYREDNPHNSILIFFFLFIKFAQSRHLKKCLPIVI